MVHQPAPGRDPEQQMWMDGRARTVRSRDIERRPRDVPARAGKFSFGPLRRRKLWTLFTL